MTKYVRNERGMVLLVAIIGLVVTGTVITGFVVSGVMERRDANSTRRSAQAFAVAEHGLGETVGNWESGVYNMLAVDSSVAVTGSPAGGSGSYTGLVRRLNNELFVVDITGQDAGSRTQQSIGALVRLRTIDMDVQAALTTQGTTKIGGNAEVDGANTDPPSWMNCDPDSNMSGIRLPPGELHGQGGCSGPSYSCIAGSPPIHEDATIDSTTFFQYGDMDWDALVAMANKPVTPGTHTGIGPDIQGGACIIATEDNWGDPLAPTSACGGYFPIMYVEGNLSISGGYGQGILLVDGNLSVQGGFEFFGIVVTKGVLKTTGTGGHFNGAVMAANVDLDDNSILGDALVQYSSCAVVRALTNAAPGALLRSRGWLYSY
jgi:Tfp pilus assembly protein PilX